MSNVRAESVEGDGPLVRIGELARRADVAPATLRAWERRYGLVDPHRTESGYRLYSRADELRVRRMSELIDAGLAPAEAARRAVADAPPPSEPDRSAADGGLVAELRIELAGAVAAFDDGRADRLLDRAVAVMTIDALLEQVLLPVLRGLENDSIGQEHFASNLIRGRLMALARGWGVGNGRLAVLACPEGELHDLGLIAFGLVLRTHGWRIGFLGANTPIEAVMAACEEMAPEAVVLSALTPGAFDGTEPQLALLAASTRLHLAGAGAPESLVERIGAARLREGPVSSAAFLVA